MLYLLVKYYQTPARPPFRGHLYSGDTCVGPEGVPGKEDPLWLTLRRGAGNRLGKGRRHWLGNTRRRICQGYTGRRRDCQRKTFWRWARLRHTKWGWTWHGITCSHREGAWLGHTRERIWLGWTWPGRACWRNTSRRRGWLGSTWGWPSAGT